MRVASVLGLAALCAISACSKPATNSPTPTAAAGNGQPAASGPDTPVTFADLPRPKAGLWQTTTDNGDGHPETSTSCLSGQAPSVAKMAQDCDPPSIKRSFTGAIIFDANCKTPQFTMTSHMVSSGDFQSHVTTDGQNTMTMAGQPSQTTKIHIDAHWVGPCAPGQKPDDAPEPSGSN